jgi:hypothetical protein
VSENGASPKVEELKLTRDPTTGVVAITTNVNLSLDQIMNILSQTFRHIEVKFRIIAAMEAQEQMRQQKADQELADRLMGKP